MAVDRILLELQQQALMEAAEKNEKRLENNSSNKDIRVIEEEAQRVIGRVHIIEQLIRTVREGFVNAGCDQPSIEDVYRLFGAILNKNVGKLATEIKPGRQRKKSIRGAIRHTDYSVESRKSETSSRLAQTGYALLAVDEDRRLRYPTRRNLVSYIYADELAKITDQKEEYARKMNSFQASMYGLQQRIAELITEGPKNERRLSQGSRELIEWINNHPFSKKLSREELALICIRKAGETIYNKVGIISPSKGGSNRRHSVSGLEINPEINISFVIASPQMAFDKLRRTRALTKEVRVGEDLTLLQEEIVSRGFALDIYRLDYMYPELDKIVGPIFKIPENNKDQLTAGKSKYIIEVDRILRKLQVYEDHSRTDLIFIKAFKDWLTDQKEYKNISNEDIAQVLLRNLSFVELKRTKKT